ncbi:MAG: hypothetical protein KDC72_09340, partial [Bacteroidetes bacterium]|nr:hypothetical protein [Bacteroidota bacterium]
FIFNKNERKTIYNYLKDWKKHFSQRIKINQEHFFWAQPLKSFSKQLPNIMKSDEVYLTKFSKKLFCCLGYIIFFQKVIIF